MRERIAAAQEEFQRDLERRIRAVTKREPASQRITIQTAAVKYREFEPGD